MCWDITLKSGITASFAIREDLGDILSNENGWTIFTIPREKRVARLRVSEIAGMNYYEVEQREIPVFKPKHVRDKTTSPRSAQEV